MVVGLRRENNARMSSDNEPVPRLQCVTVDGERVCFVVDRPIQISEPKVGG